MLAVLLSCAGWAPLPRRDRGPPILRPPSAAARAPVEKLYEYLPEDPARRASDSSAALAAWVAGAAALPMSLELARSCRQPGVSPSLIAASLLARAVPP